LAFTEEANATCQDSNRHYTLTLASWQTTGTLKAAPVRAKASIVQDKLTRARLHAESQAGLKIN
jgi:hypothetical protein